MNYTRENESLGYACGSDETTGDNRNALTIQYFINHNGYIRFVCKATHYKLELFSTKTFTFKYEGETREFFFNNNRTKINDSTSWSPVNTFAIYCTNRRRAPDNFSYMRCYEFSAHEVGVGAINFIPSLDSAGTPCMFDTVTRKPFYNEGTGSFLVGLTLAQAAQLGRKLPSTGGALTLSLPEGYDMDERVVNALSEAESKGWVLTIQTYAAETAAATFALRRVWVRRQQDENGSYVAADGSRWQVEWCVDVIGADSESLGYERFRSVEAATAYWELEPYIDPNAEELLTETE